MTPRTFLDNLGRVWSVSVVYNSIVAVLSMTGLDLRQLVADHDTVSKELDDPIKLKQVLGVLLSDQLTKLKLTIDDVFSQIVTESQASEMVMSVYQATFDFFQGQGGVLNDALTRVQRAQETAKAVSIGRVKSQIDNGQMDRYLSIVMDAEQMAKYVDASTSATFAPLWGQVQDIEQTKRLAAYVRLIVERELFLPEEKPKIQAKTFPTFSANAGGLPASSASIPASTPGDNSV